MNALPSIIAAIEPYKSDNKKQSAMSAVKSCRNDLKSLLIKRKKIRSAKKAGTLATAVAGRTIRFISGDGKSTKNKQ